jgi:hypothetical protein
MFTPIGFFAPQGAAGFDPSLGGTLSVKYHWDFGDSSTMTLSGTDILDITDKKSSYTLTSYGTQDPTLSDGYAQFGLGSVSTAMRSGANSLPPGMFSNNTFTICVFSQIVGSFTDQGLWNLQSNQTNGWRGATFGGWRTSMPGSWDPQLCNNYGSNAHVMMRWFGTSNQSKYSTYNTSVGSQLSLVGFGYDTTNAYLLCDADGISPTYCSRAFVNSTSTGDGFYVSVADTVVNYYHIVVYDQLIDSTEMSAVWDAFYALQP